MSAAALRAARDRADLEVFLCDAGSRPPPSVPELGRDLSVALALRAFGGPVSLRQALRGAAGLPVAPLVPPDRDVNHPEFVGFVRRELRPDAALSLGCEQIVGRELLAALRRPANYHTSLLPAYRGLRSTGWSLYRGEEVTGFSYHLMEPGIDTGPILLQGSIPIGPGARAGDLESAKTRLAAELMPRALDGLLGGDPGRTQTGTPSYYGREELLRVTSVRDPSVLSWEDLQRRLRAFSALTLTLRGARYTVTRLRSIRTGRPGHPELAFLTADGVVAEPSRLRHLPVSLHRACRRLRGRPPHDGP